MYCCPWLTTFNVEVQPRHIKYKHKQFQKFGSEEDNCYISFLKFVTQDQKTQQIKERREAEKKIYTNNTFARINFPNNE